MNRCHGTHAWRAGLVPSSARTAPRALALLHGRRGDRPEQPRESDPHTAGEDLPGE